MSKRYLILVDDGWRHEKRELLRFLEGNLDFDVVTHNQESVDKLDGHYRVIKIPTYPLRGRLHYAMVMFFARELDTTTVKRRRAMYLREKPLWIRIMQKVRDLANALGLCRYNYSEAFAFLYRRSRCYEELLADYDALLFCPVHTEDMRIVYEARQQGLDVVCWVYSWDNPMKHNEFIHHATRYLVWNDEVSERLQVLHHIAPALIRVVGPVQFDYLLENGASPPPAPVSAGRYVLFCCSMGRPFHIRQEVEMIIAIRRVIDEIDPGVRLVVRRYPFSFDEHAYEALEAHEDIEVPRYGQFDDWKLEVTREDLDAKFVQMREAECFVNFGSTIVLEASFTDTPILQVCFNLPHDYPPEQDMLDVLRNDHFRFIVLDEYPNVVRSLNAFKVALRDILEGRVEPYRAYTERLRKFARPLEADSFREVFLQALRE